MAVISTVRIAGTPRDKARDPKSGRFVRLGPRTEVVRSVVVRGKRVTLARTNKAKARRSKRSDLGGAFEAEARPREAADTMRNQSELGRAQFVKVGGKVYRVQKGKEADLQAFVADISSKFYQLARKAKVGSPDLWLGVTIGDAGAMLDLDRIDMMDPELAEEFAGSREFRQSQRSLAAYVGNRFRYYMGHDVDEEGLAEYWSERLGESADEFSDDEDNEDDEDDAED